MNEFNSFLNKFQVKNSDNNKPLPPVKESRSPSLSSTDTGPSNISVISQPLIQHKDDGDLEDQQHCCGNFILPPYHLNPITKPKQRDSVQFLILVIVNVARLCFMIAILVALSVTPYSGLPTISLLLNTEHLLSKFLLVLEFLYVMTMTIVVVTMTSATFARNDLEGMIEYIQIKTNESDDKWSWALWWLHKIAHTSIPLYATAFVFFLLIYVVPVFDYPEAHDVIAIIGIIIMLVVQSLLVKRRIITNKTYIEYFKVIDHEDKDTSFGTKRYQYIIWLNMFVIFLGMVWALVFIILSHTTYRAESTSAVSLFEYLLYDTVIVLDSFRVLDVWVSLRDD